MSFHFITYGDKKFAKSKKRILKEAKALGVFSTIKAFDSADLPNWFCKKFANILSEPRGGGYWIWKPIIISETLKKINDGDYLLYIDSGCTINKQGLSRFNEYIKMLDESKYGILSFQMNGLDERCWTTKQIIDFLGETNESEYALSGQYMATIMLLKKCEHSINFVEKWLETITNNSLLITDYYNDKGQEIYFKDNRHDQSIASILRKQMGSVVLPDETFFQPFGSEESLKYPFWATRIKE